MATQSQAVVPAAAPQFGAAAAAKRLKVVVVDDSPIFLELVCVLLEKNDAVQVSATANDGAAAIRAVFEHHPDVVLMDIDMPKMSGLTASAILSLAYSKLKVVLMSAEDTFALRMEAAESGAHAFLDKGRISVELPELLCTFAQPNPA